MNLTTSQMKVLRAIIVFTKDKGFSPTVRELADLTGFKSLSSVHAHIKKLELYGYILTEQSKSRTIKLNKEFICENGFLSLFE